MCRCCAGPIPRSVVGNKKTLATRRGSLRLSVVRFALASVPPSASVLPPGAGNEEPKKALKADDERAKKTEEGTVRQTRVVQGHLDTPAIRANRDCHVASIAAIEQTQGWSPERTRKIRAVRAVYEALDDHATTRTAPDPGCNLSPSIPVRRGRRSRSGRSSPDTKRPPVARRSPAPRHSPVESHSTSSAAPPREPRPSWQARKGPEGPGRPEPSACEPSDQYQRRPAPSVRASDARSVSTPVKRARFAFTMDSFVSQLNVHRRSAAGRSSEEDPWLCVPASRRVCPGR